MSSRRLSCALLIVMLLPLAARSVAAQEFKPLEALDDINLMIDRLPTEEVRQQERLSVRRVGGAILDDDLEVAIKSTLAASNAAATPDLRNAWRSFVERLHEESVRRAAEDEKLWEEYQVKANALWAARDVEVFDRLHGRLTELPAPQTQEVSEKVESLREVIDQWRAMWTAREQSRYRSATAGLKKLAEQPGIVPPEAVSSMRRDLVDASARAVNEFVDDYYKRLFTCRTLEELSAMGNWRKQHDLREMAYGSEEVNRTVSDFERPGYAWRDILTLVDEENYASAISSVEGLGESANFAPYREQINAILPTLREAHSAQLARTEAARRRLEQQRRDCQSLADVWMLPESDHLRKLLVDGQYVELLNEVNRRIETNPDSQSLKQLRQEIEGDMLVRMAFRLEEWRGVMAESSDRREISISTRKLAGPYHAKVISPDTPGFGRMETLHEIGTLLESILPVVTVTPSSDQIKTPVSRLRELRNELHASDRGWFDETIEARMQKAEDQRQREADAQIARIDAEIAKYDPEQGFGDLVDVLTEAAKPSHGFRRSTDELSLMRSDVSTIAYLKSNITEGGITGDVARTIESRTEKTAHRWSDWTNQLVNELVVAELETTGQLQGLKPKQGETVRSMLLRTADEAVEQEDWTRVYRVLEVYRTIFSANARSEAWVDAEIQGCQSFVTAQRFEAAGNILGARDAYFAVLALHGERVPIAQSRARLADLRKNHPDVFQAPVGVPASGK